MEATTSRLLRGIPIVLLAWAAPPGAGGQDVGGPAWAGAAGVRLESYGFARPERTGIARVSLLTVPLAARARLAGGVRVALQGGWAAGRLVRADGGRATLSGPTDTELRVAVPVAGDWMTLTGAAVIPTGRQRLTAGELEVAAVVASDLLPFAISHWGGGALGGAGVELAPRRGDFRLALSGGYLAARGYHALDGGGAYRPGDETYLLASAGHAAGAGKATLEGGMHRFSRDRLAGAGLYRAGNRYHLTASYAFAGEGRVGGVGGVAYAGVLHRERGAGLGTLSQDLPAQDLGLLGLALRLPVGRGALLPSVDGRVFHSADGVGKGFGAAFGAAAEVPAFGAVLVPSARLRTGRVLVSGGTGSRFTGAELGLTLRGGRR